MKNIFFKRKVLPALLSLFMLIGLAAPLTTAQAAVTHTPTQTEIQANLDAIPVVSFDADGSLDGDSSIKVFVPSSHWGGGDFRWLMSNILNSYVPDGTWWDTVAGEEMPYKVMPSLAANGGKTIKGESFSTWLPVTVSHIWKDAEGNPIYCFDIMASEHGNRGPVTVAELAAQGVDTTLLKSVYGMALKMTENNFAYLRQHAAEFFLDITVGHPDYSFTVPKEVIGSVFAKASNDTLQTLVQLFVWQRMNALNLYGNEGTNVHEEGGTAIVKGGQVVFAPASNSSVVPIVPNTGVPVGVGSPTEPGEMTYGGIGTDTLNESTGQLLVKTPFVPEPDPYDPVGILLTKKDAQSQDDVRPVEL